MQSWITLAIAIFVAAIGFFQWQTARQKIVLDLFEKRFEVYLEILSVVAYFGQRSVFDEDRQRKFARAQTRAKFLFGPEVESYLESCRKDLIRADHQLNRSNPVPEERLEAAQTELGDRIDRLTISFYADFDRLVSPYMKHPWKVPSDTLSGLLRLNAS